MIRRSAGLLLILGLILAGACEPTVRQFSDEYTAGSAGQGGAGGEADQSSGSVAAGAAGYDGVIGGAGGAASTAGSGPQAEACSAIENAECQPGETEIESRGCGSCNTGKQQRSRSCQPSTCTWENWSSWGECENVTAECTPLHYRCCDTGKWEWCYTDTCDWTGSCSACSKGNCPDCHE